MFTGLPAPSFLFPSRFFPVFLSSRFPLFHSRLHARLFIPGNFAAPLCRVDHLTLSRSPACLPSFAVSRDSSCHRPPSPLILIRPLSSLFVV